MAIDNVLTISTNELFRDDPYMILGANIVPNGNMETSGGWLGKRNGSSSSLSIDTANQKASMFAYSTEPTIYSMEIYQDITYQQIEAHQIYFSWQSRVWNRENYASSAGSFNLCFYLDSAIYSITDSVPYLPHSTTYTPDEDDLWEQYDYIYTVPSAKSTFLFRTYTEQGLPYINQSTWSWQLRKVGGVDLTLLHGAGNEPDIAECRILYPDIYETPTTIKIEDTIKANILSDYSNGIITAKHNDIACLDVYNIDGDKVLDFSKGEILKVGDIVRIDKDNDGNSLLNKPDGSPRYFQIVERTFKKSGVPSLALKYREVK